MSQRDSGYARKRNDDYPTPDWVTEVLLPHIPRRCKNCWEPASGNGAMAKVLQQKFVLKVHATNSNFLKSSNRNQCDSIITNPPYAHAEEFIRHAIELTRAYSGFVAML